MNKDRLRLVLPGNVRVSGKDVHSLAMALDRVWDKLQPKMQRHLDNVYGMFCPHIMISDAPGNGNRVHVGWRHENHKRAINKRRSRGWQQVNLREELEEALAA